MEYPFYRNLILGRLGIYGRLGARVRERLGLAYVYSSIEPNALLPWTVRQCRSCLRGMPSSPTGDLGITATPVFGTEFKEAVGYVWAAYR